MNSEFEAGNFGKPGTKYYDFAKLLTHEWQTPKELSEQLGLDEVWHNPLDALADRGIAEKAEMPPKRFRRGPNYDSFCRQRKIVVDGVRPAGAGTTARPETGPRTSGQQVARRTIEIDDEVWHALQTRAEPFVETTPNDVLRRLLELNA